MLHKTFSLSACGQSATLVVYIQDVSDSIDPNRLRPTVIVCPGGGYRHTADREAEPVALALLQRGFNVCVLRYTTAPARFPTQLAQLAKAMLFVREHAAAWHVDAGRISVLGFSAGGHLAASLGTLWNSPVLAQALPGEDLSLCKPYRMVLSYPVITSGEFAHGGSFENLLGEECEDKALREAVSLEKQVGPHTPPTFLWHTVEDASVPVENSLLFAGALRRAKVPFELHVYPLGAHGLSLASEETHSAERGYWGVQPECQNWVDMAARFLKMELE